MLFCEVFFRRDTALGSFSAIIAPQQRSDTAELAWSRLAPRYPVGNKGCALFGAGEQENRRAGDECNASL